MRIACWITKVTNTHLEYVIIIAFASKKFYTNTSTYFLTNIFSVFLFVRMIIPWPIYHCTTSRHVDSLGLYNSPLLHLFPLWRRAKPASIVFQIPFGIFHIFPFRKRTIPIPFTPLCLQLTETPLRQKGNMRQINNPCTVNAYQLKPAVEWACSQLQPHFAVFFPLINSGFNTV
jgi:hypothetical protein